MKNLLILLEHLMTTAAKLLGLAGARAVVADTEHHLLLLAT